MDILQIGPNGDCVQPRQLFAEQPAFQSGMNRFTDRLFPRQFPIAFAENFPDPGGRRIAPARVFPFNEDFTMGHVGQTAENAFGLLLFRGNGAPRGKGEVDPILPGRNYAEVRGADDEASRLKVAAEHTVWRDSEQVQDIPPLSSTVPKASAISGGLGAAKDVVK